MRTSWKTLLLFVPVVVMTIGCNLEREVEIELPDYERQLVAECFMEVGGNFRLLLTESVGFSEGNDTPIVAGAEVIISHGNVHDTLDPGVYVDPIGWHVFNFNSQNVVPADFSSEYTLKVTHPDGRSLSGKAKVMPKISMDGMSFSYNADSNVSATMRWPDPPNQNNFYRLTLHKSTLFHGQVELPSPLEFDFTLDDRIGDGQFFTIGTLFTYQPGDTLITTLYHIDEGYWKYLNSLGDAIGSNGNPFAQPGVIHSTVVGGLGVFTGYQYDRDTFYIP